MKFNECQSGQTLAMLNSNTASSLKRPEQYGFVLDREALEAHMSKARRESLKIQSNEICEGLEFFSSIKCQSCNDIPTDQFFECSRQDCEQIICEHCIQQKIVPQGINAKCPFCNLSFEKKPINRKVKEIALSVMRIRHKCFIEQSIEKENLDFVLQKNSNELQNNFKGLSHSLCKLQSTQPKKLDLSLQSLQSKDHQSSLPLSPMVLGYGSRETFKIELSPLNRDAQISDIIQANPHENNDQSLMLRRIPSLSDLQEQNSNQESKKVKVVDNFKMRRLEDEFCIPANIYIDDIGDTQEQPQKQLVGKELHQDNTCSIWGEPLYDKLLKKKRQNKQIEKDFDYKQRKKFNDINSKAMGELVKDGNNIQGRQPELILTYEEYLKHKLSDCNLQLNCPNNCELKFKTLDQLRQHLAEVCPKSEYKCENCKYKMFRMNIQAKHDSYPCIHYLKQTVMELERENKELKSKQQKSEALATSNFQYNNNSLNMTNQASSSLLNPYLHQAPARERGFIPPSFEYHPLARSHLEPPGHRGPLNNANLTMRGQIVQQSGLRHQRMLRRVRRRPLRRGISHVTNNN